MFWIFLKKLDLLDSDLCFRFIQALNLQISYQIQIFQIFQNLKFSDFFSDSDFFRFFQIFSDSDKI